MTPYSKTKLITVEGNERLTAQQVEELSLISPKDYAVTIALNAANYASNIKSLTQKFQMLQFHFIFQINLQFA